MKWQPESLSCVECAFDWQVAPDAAIEIVKTSPSSLRVADPVAWSESRSAAVWSPLEYLWHLVDVLRIGSERLWTIAHDPQTSLVCWDENELAQVRKYSQLSPLVGKVAYADAAATWVGAAHNAPLDTRVEHDALGTLSAVDIIRRNAHEVQHHRLDIVRELQAQP